MLVVLAVLIFENLEIEALQAALVIIALYTLKAFVMFIPVMPLYIGAGMMFSVPYALLLTMIGLFCNMSIGYYLGKRYGTERVMPLLQKNKKIQKFLANSRYTGNALCFFLRFFLAPLDLPHLFFGATGLKFPYFVLFTFLGLAPRMVTFILLGETVASSFSLKFLIPFGLVTALSLVAFVTVQKLEQRK